MTIGASATLVVALVKITEGFWMDCPLSVTPSTLHEVTM
jgi:hypothetical protein